MGLFNSGRMICVTETKLTEVTQGGYRRQELSLASASEVIGLD
jgi:hypothetical protein